MVRREELATEETAARQRLASQAPDDAEVPETDQATALGRRSASVK
jgi:hypothetical protein